MRSLSDAELSRFWAFVVKPDGEDGCWLYAGPRDVYGYGRFRHVLGVHRMVWELDSGQPVPRRMMICHICDVPFCVNPLHLFLGTARDNAIDRELKGRHGKGFHSVRTSLRVNQKGQRYRKLTPDQVREIRTRYASREADQKTLSDEYGISQQNISAIVNRIKWAHVV